MKFSAEQIASMLDGAVEGNPSVEVSALAKIEEGHSGASDRQESVFVAKVRLLLGTRALTL